MFKSIDKHCVHRPLLLKCRTDPESVQWNRLKILHDAVMTIPYKCAWIASFWKNNEEMRLWIRILCFRRNCCAIQSVILEFAAIKWHFPYIDTTSITGAYRISAKGGSDQAIATIQGQRDFMETHPNRIELEFWI